MKLEKNKLAEINVRSEHLMVSEIHKPFGFASFYWSKWAVISKILQDIRLSKGSLVLDIGCGAGWTSTFLAESGFRVTGIDIVPLNIATAKKRVGLKNLKASFRIEDMEKFKLNKSYDAILIFDALHHTNKQTKVLRNIMRHLKPGGWVIIGEPSLLHLISPEARRVTREEGIIERGLTAHSIKKDLKNCGFQNLKRYYEGTHPYNSKISGFLWQLIRLIGANFVFAPQSSVWCIAQKPEHSKK